MAKGANGYPPPTRGWSSRGRITIAHITFLGYRDGLSLSGGPSGASQLQVPKADARDDKDACLRFPSSGESRGPSSLAYSRTRSIYDSMTAVLPCHRDRLVQGWRHLGRFQRAGHSNRAADLSSCHLECGSAKAGPARFRRSPNRSTHTSRQPVRTTGRGSKRATQHSCQRQVSHLLRLDRRRSRRSRDN